MSQLSIQASNIKCGGCVSNIKNGLKDIKGLKSVTVNIESNVVNIDGDNIDHKVIEDKLSELGYPAISG